MKLHNKFIYFGILVLIIVPLILFFTKDSVNMYSESINIYLIFILVLVTAWYAYFAQTTVKEIRENRLLNIRPVLVPELITIIDPKAWGEKFSCTTIEMKNLGNGPAFSIDVALINPETGSELVSSKNSVDYLTADSKTDDNHIHIENSRLRNLKYKEDEKGMIAHILVRLNYDDIFGKTYTSNRIFFFKKGENIFRPVVGSFNLNNKLCKKCKKG